MLQLHHKTMPKACLWLCLGLLMGQALSCGGPQPARQELISSMRILAIQATPPTARPGTEIKLRALVASPYIRTISYQWFACAAQGDINNGCADKADAIKLGTGNTATYKVPADFLPDKPTALEAFRGRYLPITLVAKAGPYEETSIKRIVVALLQSNRNPQINDVQLFQGQQKTPLLAPWSLSAGARCEFRPTLAKEARESYTTVDTEGQLHQVDEELFFSWYITGGQLSDGRTSNHDSPNKAWVTPQVPPSESQGKAYLYIVLRDGRGGVDWSEHELHLR